MNTFIQAQNLSQFPSLEHGFLTRNQLLTPEPCLLKQIHSCKIIFVDKPLPEREKIEADGMVTNIPGIALGIQTADCVPVLLFDPEAHVIGALHAGWKGAFSGICEEAIEKMEKLGSKRNRILASLGPAISQETYEVSPEFKVQFLDQDPANEKFFIPSIKEHHFLFDLKGYVEKCLYDAGIKFVETIPFNTYTSPDFFHSFRRSTHEGKIREGNNISFIKLKNES